MKYWRQMEPAFVPIYWEFAPGIEVNSTPGGELLINTLIDVLDATISVEGRIDFVVLWCTILSSNRSAPAS